MRLVESPVHVSVTVHVDPADVVLGLEEDEGRVLAFILQLVALCRSPSLRDDLVRSLDPESWSDAHHVPAAERAATEG